MSETTKSPRLTREGTGPKKRGIVFTVIVISVGLHVAGLGILGVVKIVEVISKPPEFEAPPVEAAQPPPPPPPPKPTVRQTQRSMPRPQPLAAQNPSDMSVPAIQINEASLNLATGRGFGGGLGEIGGGVMDEVSFSFFGAEGSGNKIIFILDMSNTGFRIFDRVRQELAKTVESFEGNPNIRFAVIYFGGSSGGSLSKGPERGHWDNLTEEDYYFPSQKPKGWGKEQDLPGSTGPGQWMRPGKSRANQLLREMMEVPLETKEGNIFMFGSNYMGALNVAYQMQPDVIYLMIDPWVPFRYEKITSQQIDYFTNNAVEKPENTTVNAIMVGGPNKVKETHANVARFLDAIHGGLSENKIDDQITVLNPRDL